jgi:hypothetical protein
VYLFLCVHKVEHGEPRAYPIANIPVVELPAADPPYEGTVDDVAAVLVSPEYVYLLRVVVPLQPALVAPNAKIPTVELPTAEPFELAVVADVAEVLVQLEYVYLSRVFVLT